MLHQSDDMPKDRWIHPSPASRKGGDKGGHGGRARLPSETKTRAIGRDIQVDSARQRMDGGSLLSVSLARYC